MAIYCLKCDRRVPDQELPDDGRCLCGANEWVAVPEPQKPFTLTLNDRTFLKSIRIKPEP